MGELIYLLFTHQ